MSIGGPHEVLPSHEYEGSAPPSRRTTADGVRTAACGWTRPSA